ncbi:MAG TPA: PRC-barrel domain-containing protein, partial [Deinococcales bacterium]|nr:PRC-barrel domain-containing protein [Deinococcales bacterium]
MRKGRDIVGKPVVSLEGGTRIAAVKDLVFDQDENILLGFVVDEGGWFSRAKVLPFAAVQSIGEDAVVINNQADIRPADSLPAVDGILRRKNLIGSTTLMTTDGRNLGRLTDLFVDETSGQVTGYEVTGGLFSDLSSGRSFVPAPSTITIGDDVAFVPPETAAEMEEREPGGIQGAFNSAQASAQEAAGRAGEAAAERAKEFAVGKTASRDVVAPDGLPVVAKGETITEAHVLAAEDKGCLPQLTAAAGLGALQGAAAQAGGRLSDNALEATRGRRVGREVRAEGGLLVAAQGQIVTDPVIERARLYHREGELIAAVGGATAQSAGENVSAAAGDLRESAGNLIDRAKQSFAQARDRAAQEEEERRVRASLGRPVSRVILDPQDAVILNVGELVTHHAVS